jgi:pimeloyl-ACP methyl ester carboxylesterase
MKEMVKALFHADTDPALIAEAQQRMMKTSPATAHAMFLGMAGYEMAASARKLTVPLRAINGDLYETDIQAVRKIKADFDAVIMKHVGHYPMLEKPDEFNRLVTSVAEDLVKKSK